MEKTQGSFLIDENGFSYWSASGKPAGGSKKGDKAGKGAQPSKAPKPAAG